MNYRVVIRTLGTMFIILGCCMIPSYLAAIYYKDDASLCALMSVSVLMILMGFGIRIMIPQKNENVKLREGYLIVVLTWFSACVFCALPYYISGCIPNYFDALFESTSGITTTGSSILTDIEALPPAMLFWRAFTHWMGGLGILTIAIAILPTLGISGFQMARAEASNSDLSKTTPKMADMAKILYKTYFLLSAACIILLMIGDIGFFDASTHAFSAIATGGFSPKNASVGGLNSLYAEIILSIFMVIGSISFPILYMTFTRRRLRYILKNQEIKFFLALLLGGCILCTVILTATGTADSLPQAAREGFFHAIAVMTTTGFATGDYNLWPAGLTIILLMLSICGGCSGSTTGGVKAVRVMITSKLILREFSRKLHPRAVYAIKLNNNTISYDTGITAAVYIFFFLMICCIGGIIVSLDPGSDLITAFTASMSSMTNLGPGFAKVGPCGNYAFFQSWTKVLLSALMVIGKLEIFAVLTLFTPSFWNPDKF